MTTTLNPTSGSHLHIPTAEERAVKKRKARFYDKPGWLTYGLLAAFFLGAVFPLWWSFVIGEPPGLRHQRGAAGRDPRAELPRERRQGVRDGRLRQGALNSIIISGTIAVAVVFFSTLAGYAFAKLSFKGRNPLMIAVIATMAIPTQLGIIPLFMLVSETASSPTRSAPSSSPAWSARSACSSCGSTWST